MKNIILALLLSVTIHPDSIFAQQKIFQPTTVKKAVYSDAIPSLLDLPVISPRPVRAETNEDEVENETNLHESRNLPPNKFLQTQDPALQEAVKDNMPVPMAPIQNFDGISNTWGVYPPDTQGDVGPGHYVQVVNLGFQIWNKTGTSLYGPANLSTIWTGIPSPWNNTNNGDPIVLYDQAANRWMISQFSLPNTTQYAMLIAISQTDDPTGAWHRYVFEFGSKMPDYPKFGVWPDGYYMAINQFISGSSWGGVGACAFERSKMLTGDPTARMVYFDLGAASDPGGMLPADWDGTTAPVANEPNYFSYFNDWSSTTTRYLKIWNFHVDWTTTTNSTFSEAASLVTASFNTVDGNVIPQSGSTVLLEALGDRLMYRLQYRNFGDHRSMVTNHTVDANGTGRAGIRWYELRNTGSGWSIYQQGTYSPDATYRWMGSIAMNASGDIALGYSASDATIFPSIRYTGRLAGDPLGQMTFAEQTIMAGTGYQSGTAARWGDYSMMSVDPVDDATFWYTTEYIQTSGSVSWKTRIASFLFGPVVPGAQFSANNTKPCLNATAIFTDQTTGIPASWSWSVTPATFVYTDGTTSTSQNPHIKFTAYGNYTIALTATNAQGSNTMTKTNYISVNAANADFTASLTTLVVGNSTTFTDASTCGISSWSWNFGPGASPATASTMGPHVVTYNTTGQKTVTLTVNGSVIQTKTNYITVTDPIFNITNGTVTTCTGNFYDSGGSAGAYLDNETFTETFLPATTGALIRFTFSSFSTELGYDTLTIYNGINTSAPVIGKYHGTTSPGTVTASNASGALTFRFHSDASVTSTGWAAAISCYSTAIPPVAQFTASSTSPAINSTVTFSDQSTNFPTSWVWSFSPNTVVYTGGTTATSQNPQVQFTSLGQYTVSLIATNAYGSDPEVKTNYINVVPFTYCIPTYTTGTSAGDYISLVQLGTINNSTSASLSPYYTYYSSLTTDLTPGNAYTITLSPGTYTSGNNISVWIDYNQNGAFETSEKLGNVIIAAKPATGTIGFTVPATATTGPARMRVREVWNNSAFDACSNYTYGETEDYNVNILSLYKNLNLTVFLEGLFNGTTMNKAKNATGDQYPGTIADQITLELHNSTSPYSLAGGPYTANVNLDGSASVTIPAALGSSYYIVVKHRNHLETWNASPLSFSGASISYNFSSSPGQAFGNNLKLMSGKYVLFGGDVNQDGIIDAGDMIGMDNDAANFISGYFSNDVNGDGVVNLADIQLVGANAAVFVAKITP
jgi:PKD repeat protein